MSPADAASERNTPGPGRRDGPPPVEEIFETLKNGRRRGTLRYLAEVGGSAAIDDLARHLATEEQGSPVSDTSDRAYKSVYVALYQSHLPKMEEVGAIAYDRDDRRLALTDDAHRFLSYLHPADGALDRPPVDVVESPDHVTVIVDLPGYDRESVRLEADATGLTVSACRAETRAEDGEEVARRERPGTVQRTVPLPGSADVAEADAAFDDGVLTITFPKFEGGRRVIELGS